MTPEKDTEQHFPSYHMEDRIIYIRKEENKLKTIEKSLKYLYLRWTWPRRASTT